MTLVTLFEQTVATDAAGTTKVLRYASGDGYNHKSAPGFYAPRIASAATYRRDIFAAGRIGGGSQVGGGGLTLKNGDRALNAELAHGWVGHPYRILVGDDRGAYSTFAVMLTGIAEQPVPSGRRVEVRLRDREQDLQRPICSTRLGGTNTGPLGIDGNVEDKDRRIPVTLGRVTNVQPLRVATLPIYRVNAGPIVDMPAFRSEGVPWGRKPDYPDVATMLANEPGGGYYAICPSAGIVYAGSEPPGTVSCDVVAGASAADRTAAQIIRQLALHSGRISAGEIVAGDVAALDTLQPAELGLYVADDRSIASGMDAAAETVGAWRGFDRLGRFRMARVSGPTGAPKASFRLWDGSPARFGDQPLLSLEPLPPAAPAHAIRLAYGRNPTVIAKPAAGLEDAETIAWLRDEWRWVDASDPAVLAKYPGAVELVFGDGYKVDATGARIVGPGTLFADRTQAQAEAARRLVVFGPRRRWRATVTMRPEIAALIDLGDEIELIHPGYGLAAPLTWVITGMEYSRRNMRGLLEVWG